MNTPYIIRNSLDEHRIYSNSSTPIQRVHRKPVTNNPVLYSTTNKKKNYAEADTVHPNRIKLNQYQENIKRYSYPDTQLKKSKSTTTTTNFWYPRKESQTEPLEPLKRELSKKLRGLLLPQRTFIEKEVNNEQYVKDYKISLRRCESPPIIEKQPDLMLLNIKDVKKWNEKDFVKIDNYALTVQQTLLTPTILSQKFLVRPYRKDVFKLRSLFIWLIQNIRPEYDLHKKPTIDLAQPQMQQQRKKKRMSSVYHVQNTTITTLQDQFNAILSTVQESPETVLENRICKSSFSLAKLFVIMAQAAGFTEAQVVYGYLKKPKDTISILKENNNLPINHAWCSVKIDGEYRFIDCWLASPYNNENKIESHWFLCSPNEMILTHFPKKSTEQYLNQPIKSIDFFKLPFINNSFFWYPIEIQSYNLNNQENMFYVIFKLNDKNLNCYVETESRQDHIITRGLSQCMVDEQDNRVFKIKGLLPSHESSGWLKVYIGLKSDSNNAMIHDDQENSEFDNILFKQHYSLSMCINIHQTAIIPQTSAFEFVKVLVDHNEFYIKEPQCYYLYPLQTYHFSIKANRLDYYYNRSTHYKLAIKSPSGKLVKLMYYPQDQSYDGNIKISETGKWSLICLLHHTGNSYTVATWVCNK